VGLSIQAQEYSPQDYQNFRQRLEENLQALTQVLSNPSFGVGPTSIGAELEVFLVNDTGHPLPISQNVLGDLQDERITLELDRFNLEYNLSPVAAAGTPFTSIEQELDVSIARIDRAAAGYGASTIAIGILPTLTLAQLQENAMTEIALAMSMGFFSIMVLTALSMGVAAPDGRADSRNIATAAIADSGAAAGRGTVDRLTDDDVLVVFDGERVLGRDLRPLDPSKIDVSRRIVLAVGPDLTMEQTLQARRGIAGDRLVITTLDADWRRALKERRLPASSASPSILRMALSISAATSASPEA